MGQARLDGAAPLMAFEKLTPGDFIGLKQASSATRCCDRDGGILDDLAGRRRTARGCSSCQRLDQGADFALMERELGTERP
jgi:hypothetical protein